MLLFGNSGIHKNGSNPGLFKIPRSMSRNGVCFIVETWFVWQSPPLTRVPCSDFYIYIFDIFLGSVHNIMSTRLMWPLSYHTFVPRLLHFCHQFSNFSSKWWRNTILRKVKWNTLKVKWHRKVFIQTPKSVVHLNFKFRVVRKLSHNLRRGKFKSSSTNIFFNIFLYQILNTPPKRPWEQLPDVVLPVPKFVLGASKFRVK